MPEITSIEPQKKKAGRFNIFLDGKFAFGVGEEAIIAGSLKEGKILSQDEIDRVLKKEEVVKLQDIAIRFLNFRPRSEKEIRDHLTRKIAQKESIKFSQAQDSPLIEPIISKLKKYKLINDLEFTKWFVESRIRSHPRSIRLIALELKRKGIDSALVESTLKKADNEKDLAIKAVSKKVKRWQKLPENEFKKKLYQFLLGRGFGFETIKETFAFLKEKR